MPLAMSFVWELAKFEKKSPEVAKLLKRFDTVLGIEIGKQQSNSQQIPQEILKLVEQRNKARKNKDWAKSDELRIEIENRGYLVEDTKEGVVIKIRSQKLEVRSWNLEFGIRNNI